MVVSGVGNSRIKRVRKIMLDPSLMARKRPRPPHAVLEEDIQNLKNHLGTYETEDGYPCAHRRPRKFFVKPGLRWKNIWESYDKCMSTQEPPKRSLSFVR